MTLVNVNHFIKLFKYKRNWMSIVGAVGLVRLNQSISSNSVVQYLTIRQGPLLLTWFYFDPNMDK